MTESSNLQIKNTCSYCGEAPVNHQLLFLENLISNTLDTHAVKLIKHVPNFLKDFVDLIPKFLFETLAFLKIVKFSSDINKAHTFRSRIIWEEAERRSIVMEQVMFLDKPLDHYRAKLKIKNKIKNFYFESIPIRPEFLEMDKNWDDKVVLKQEFLKRSIPAPICFELSFWSFENLEKIFSKFTTPIIIKPRIGSRARHTVTNINTIEHFKNGINLARQISPYLIIEEHLDGYICRATVVNGVVVGFYRGSIPHIIGDGEKTVKQLIEEKNKKQIDRYHVRITNELYDHISRLGFTLDDILPQSVSISLSHRAGQLFGGATREMINELHSSFLPIFERAAQITGLSVMGFDAIIPDPTKSADSQRWGIIECNTLPFIDVHYYALEGKPKNIAGMIWDLW
ncbi:MAG: hypothetical protein WD963_00320 [Candidatus Paceibacterota bacterium]